MGAAVGGGEGAGAGRGVGARVGAGVGAGVGTTADTAVGASVGASVGDRLELIEYWCTQSVYYTLHPWCPTTRHSPTCKLADRLSLCVLDQ